MMTVMTLCSCSSPSGANVAAIFPLGELCMGELPVKENWHKVCFVSVDFDKKSKNVRKYNNHKFFKQRPLFKSNRAVSLQSVSRMQFIYFLMEAVKIPSKVAQKM